MGLAGTRLVQGAGVVAAIAWVLSSSVAIRHGLDLTDEGFYLVTYRWWDTYEPSFTGSQYLYGPLFDLLGSRIDRLRLARLLIHVLSSAYFAIAFVHWAVSRTSTTWSPAERVLIGTAIFSAGSSAYIWLPQSPGYNDATVVATVVLSAVICRTASSPPAVGSLAIGGAVLSAAIVAKWSFFATGAAFLVVVVAIRHQQGRVRAAVAACGAVAAGMGLALGLVHTIIPLSDLFQAIRESSGQLARGTNSPLGLLADYLLGAALPIGLAIMTGGVLAGTWLLGARRSERWAAPALAAVVPAVPLIIYLATSSVPRGGPHQLSLMATTWSYFVFAAVVAIALEHKGLTRERIKSHKDLPIIGWLTLAPWAQGLGTGNDLYLMALSCMAPWTALLALLWIRLRAQPSSPAAAPVASMLASCVILTAWGAASANVMSPYRTEPMWKTTTPAFSVPMLTGVRLTPEEVAAYEALRPIRQLADDHSLVVLDEVPGLSLILDMPPLAEAWTSAIDQERTWAGIRKACRSDPRRPVVIFTRPVRLGDTKALQSCGIDFYADYRLVPLARTWPEVDIYVPRTR